MGERFLMKGNEAIAEAALRAGCKCYFGYPITPQSEIANYMAQRMPQTGGSFVQAESEIAAINMVYGAACTGVRTMTSSSSPGIALKAEGLSYIAGAELPAVVVDIVRAGPGLGGILPAQSDYFMVTKGGGHGDYRNIVLAPASVQELYELTVLAFDLADKYRILSLIYADGVLGQMMEVVEFREKEAYNEAAKPWALTGTHMKRAHNIVTSVYIDADSCEKHNRHLQEKYTSIQQNETKYQSLACEDAELILVAYGTCSRVIASVIKKARQDGYKVGLLRPISLWPFPEQAIHHYAQKTKAFLSVEMSEGQMVEDVRLYAQGRVPVYFYGRNGGHIPHQGEIYEKIKALFTTVIH